MHPHPAPPGFHPIRHDRLLQEQIHDSYLARNKPAEPTRCPDCGLVFSHGRWQHGEAPANAASLPCPACQRIHDDYPAGFVTLSGAFFLHHREEILQRIAHVAERAALEHPLQRLMKTETLADHSCLTTTDIHLARALGEAVHDAYAGHLDFHYNPQRYQLRVHWQR